MLTNSGNGPQMLSDKEVIDLLLDNKRQKAGILFLYDTHFAPLSLFVTRHNGSEADAQDVFQEVVVAFVHLVRQHKFRGESSIKTFLFAMNRNIWFNELKRRGRSVERDRKFELAKQQEDESVEKDLEQREASRQLLQIMDTLGENCKKILLLFYYEHYSMKEMLSAMDYENEQVIRNKKYKCLKKLEALIQEKSGLHHQLKRMLHG